MARHHIDDWQVDYPASVSWPIAGRRLLNYRELRLTNSGSGPEICNRIDGVPVMRKSFATIVAIGSLASQGVAIAQSPAPIWDEAVGGVDTVFLEEMTAGEVAAALRSGFTSVIVATGGLEQNGPNVATGKHNVVLRATTEAIARKHGRMLVSSIVQFVPEGQIDPPTEHMNFPGTISIRQETFEALLTDICASLRQHGFRNIYLIGDSGGNTNGMENVAKALDQEWAGDGVRVAHLPEYYATDIWSFNYLKELGYTQMPDELTAFRNNVHTDLHYESIMAVVDPATVRAGTRFARGGYVVHGVEIGSERELIELGQKLIDYRADITLEAIRKLNGQ